MQLELGASITDFGVSETNPSGLEFHNNKLNMVGGNNRLYEIDKNNGRASAVRAPLNNGFGLSINNPRGITNHGGQLYMVNDGNHYLSRINAATGVATRIGNATRYGVTDLEIRDLASDGTNLYGLGKVTTSGSQTEGLYTLSTGRWDSNINCGRHF